jgi:hypothetical protein
LKAAVAYLCFVEGDRIPHHKPDAHIYSVLNQQPEIYLENKKLDQNISMHSAGLQGRKITIINGGANLDLPHKRKRN